MFIFSFLLMLLLSVTGSSQNWTYLATQGSPLASYYLGDYMTNDISFAINQDTYGKTIEFGIGTTTNGTGWTWRAATYDYQSGNDRYWKYTADNVVQFTSTGSWYYSGQFIMPTVYYASGGWAENRTTLSATSYFTVNALNNPTAGTFTPHDYSVDLAWTKDAQSHNVMIVRKTSAQSWTEPTQGTAYTVGSNIGSGVVVYNSNGTSYTNTGLSKNTTYNYKLYSENYSYYSGGVVSSATTTPVELTSFNANVTSYGVELIWQTATEQNNFGFDIERAKDNGSWKKVGFVAGSGNSNSPHSYRFIDKNLTQGSYSYRLKQIDNDGTTKYIGTTQTIVEKPKKFEVAQNYPNPFNPATKIAFNIPENGNVRITIFNAIGQTVRTLTNEYLEAGLHTVELDSKGLESGLYFYKIEASGFSEVRKMMLVK
jgi:hypothetical protein